ncbi:unnamed protein product [Rhizophagus irregularis]|nr:unnamed protein product [Rhizophagus irregularis]
MSSTFSKNLHNKHFSDPIKKKMISLLKATSKAELDQIFSDIEKSDEDGVNDWIGLLSKTLYFTTINSSGVINGCLKYGISYENKIPNSRGRNIL